MNMENKGEGILKSISSAFNLKQFLESTVDYGVKKLGCYGGSVFLFDKSTGKLKLHTHTYPEELNLRSFINPGQGIVGSAFNEKKRKIIEKGKIREEVLLYTLPESQHLRAIVAVPASTHDSDNPEAVYCFDFVDKTDKMSGLLSSEITSVEKLAKEITSLVFVNALHRSRFNQALLDIRKAGEGPGNLRQEVNNLLIRLQEKCQDTGKRKPDLAYIQLVDRRRGVIRTIQGFGLPLSFQTSLSHHLEDRDIQPYTVKERKLRLIVGYDYLFDFDVYHKYNHWKFIRLWIPLFPIPHSWMDKKTGQCIDDILRERITWGAPIDVKKKDGTIIIERKQVGQWKPEFLPPERLVYGTLEIGYERKDITQLSFESFTPELATWFASQSYQMSEELYRATLDGSLDSIGHIAASASRADHTVFIVTTSEWRTPEQRIYPIEPQWPSAVPEKIEYKFPDVKVPANIEFYQYPDTKSHDTKAPPSIEFYTNLSRCSDKNVKEMQNILKASAQDAAYLSLRLDDHATDPYLLMDEVEEHGTMGTLYPDLRIKSVLQEISRETHALQCILYLFEEKARQDPPVDIGNHTSGTNMQLLGILGWWPESEAKLPVDVQETGIIPLAHRVAEDKRSSSKNVLLGEAMQSVNLLPLELSDETTAVLVIIFPVEVTEDDMELRVFESRIARWTQRLSLRRMVQTNRFSSQMRGLRRKIIRAREIAAREKEARHINVFAKTILQDFLDQFRARGAVFTIYSESTTGPSQVERFWCCRLPVVNSQQLDSEIFIGSPSTSPCYNALTQSDLVIYGPRDQKRREETKNVDQELLDRAAKFRESGNARKAENLEGIVTLAQGEEFPSTMVVIPVSSHARPEKDIRGALSIFLEGNHRFGETQRSLVLEVGTLAAEALAQMRSLDRQAFEIIQSERFDSLRNKFGKSSTLYELVGHLFKSMGKKPDTKIHKDRVVYRDLAEDAVLWLLSKASKEKELVVRSGRGQGLDALQGIQVIDYRQHPLLNREVKAEKVPKNDFPGLTNFRLWTFSLSEENMDPIRGAYAGLGARKWLLCFPLLHADGRIRGVIDCLLDEPLLPEQEAALQSTFHELSVLFCYSLDSCRYKQVASFSRSLTIDVMKHLSAFHSQEAYQILVKSVRDEFSCTHCDLFMDLDGKMTLYITTREGGPRKENERRKFFVTPAEGSEILGNCLSTGKSRVMHASKTPVPLDHMSPGLISLFKEDYRFERLVIPLNLEGGVQMTHGLLSLRGPILPQYKSTDKGKTVKKSECFNQEHLQYADALGIVVQLAVMMSGLVDRQSWLVDELQHSLGQPLQVLRGVTDDMLEELAKGPCNKQSLISFRDNLNRAFLLVSESRNKLAIYAKMGQSKHSWSPEWVDLPKQVNDCCDFMEPMVKQGQRKLERSVQQIDSIWGHKDLLRAALFNLLDNAVKYSYKGHTIDVELVENDKGEIILTVSNYGIGIPTGDLDRIFEPYFRSRVPDAWGERKGTGIGLAIVKHAVEYVHSGKVNVTSEPPPDKEPGRAADDIANIPHKTTFTIILNRSKILDK